MKTIYKYPIEVTDEQTLTLPVNSQILTVQAQGNTPCIWAMIDTAETRTEQIAVRVYGTGHPIADSERQIYIGTFQLLGGQFVFHAFYKNNQ